MFISNALKTIGVLGAIVTAYWGYQYGAKLSLDGNFDYNLALIVWFSGAALSAVLYAIGEIVEQLHYTNYMLSRSLAPRNQNDTTEEKDC